jgi:hypothetical protein
MIKYLRETIEYHHRDPAEPLGISHHRTTWGEAVECTGGPFPCKGPMSGPDALYAQAYLVRRACGHTLILDPAVLSDHPICEGCGEPSPEGLRAARYAPHDRRDSQLCPRCIAPEIQPQT